MARKAAFKTFGAKGRAVTGTIDSQDNRIDRLALASVDTAAAAATLAN
nr:hypothetical protein [uncultured Sphingomonas sp.]